MNLKMIIRNFFVFSFILIGLIGCKENYNDEKKFNDFVESFNSNSDDLSFNVDRLSAVSYTHLTLPPILLV